VLLPDLGNCERAVGGSPPRFYYRNAGSARHRGIELSGELSVARGVRANVAWTYSDYRYRDYTFTDATVRAQPAVARGAWAEVQQTYSSGYLVSDLSSVRTAAWWATNVRIGWDGTAGSVRLAPFLGINNAFNHRYISSIVINAARDRFYEPAPGRNIYLGLSVGAGR